MKDTVIISWNFTNWLTVILMAFIGWVIFRMVAGIAKSRTVSAG